MVSARFRADETSANLTWMGLTADTRRQRPAAAVRLAARSGVRVAAGHIIRDRSVLGVSRTVAISQHVPPSRFPGSTTVIPPVNAADLPNRQGPCLRNSSGCTPRGSDKRLYPVVSLGQKNWTFAPIWAVMTPARTCLYRPARDGASSRLRVKKTDRRCGCASAPRARTTTIPHRGAPDRDDVTRVAGHGGRPRSAPSRLRAGLAGHYLPAVGRYSTVTGRWSEAARVCSVSCTRCARIAGTSGPVTRTASMRRRIPRWP